MVVILPIIGKHEKRLGLKTLIRSSHPDVLCTNNYSENFWKINRKATVTRSSFSKFAGLFAQHACFLMNFLKVFRIE